MHLRLTVRFPFSCCDIRLQVNGYGSFPDLKKKQHSALWLLQTPYHAGV